MAGVKTVHVPYKVWATGITDLIGGQVDMAFVDQGTVGPGTPMGDPSAASGCPGGVLAEC